jgi:ketosteroid isomerase-like protein
MSAEDNQNIIRRYYEEGWNQGNPAVLDELVSVDFVEHPLWPNVVNPGPEDQSPRDQLKYDITMSRDGFPDLQTTIDQQITSGDKVVTVATNRGTPVTGKPVTWTEINIDRIADSKIVERWSLWDRLGFWQQLGLVPPTRELMDKFPQ